MAEKLFEIPEGMPIEWGPADEPVVSFTGPVGEIRQTVRLSKCRVVRGLESVRSIDRAVVLNFGPPAFLKIKPDKVQTIGAYYTKEGIPVVNVDGREIRIPRPDD